MADTMGTILGKVGLGGGGGGIFSMAIYILLGLVVVILIASFIYYMYKKSLWNLNVEFKFPRSDGRIINSEWGKGLYNSKRGVVFVKRNGRGRKKVPMPPFDIKKYLQGDRYLTVIQVGIEQYVPVLVDSFVHMIDDKTGKEAALMACKIDLTESRSWRNQFEREAKTAYTIMGILEKYANFIGIGLILMMQLIGFAILYTRITG